LIDLQVNGGGGVLVNQTPTEEGIRAVAQAHRRFGTTGLLPTVVTDGLDVMRSAVTAISELIARREPGILGVHIEGPFIDVARKGAHDPRLIRPPDEEDIAWLTELDCGRVMLTLAPNRVAPAITQQLVEAGIIVSLGHAEATAEEAVAALEAGARGFTHLFNAMSGMTGRGPGMIGAALASPTAFCGLIADGFHVSTTAIRAALTAKPAGAIVLVSDAMPPAAGGPDTFTLQGREARLVAGRLQLDNGTLAGAAITLLDGVRFCVADVGAPIEEALRMASLHPAHAIGIERERGRIAPGLAADLVHVTDDLRMARATWVDGKIERHVAG
jgi:N-acetylglucosamine-6-phosphate deacetylase